MTDDAPHVDRRTLLAAAAAGIGSLAGCGAFESDSDRTTTPVGEERARTLAERFAPVLVFDADERWFPTDPRPYERERDGETVVDGFAAFDGYTERFDEAPPDPTLCYNVREYADSPLAVVQYWLYSAFDQFTTNFHWHDWEVLHVFVDTDTGDPQLYVASAHAGSVPNNEFLDPDPAGRPRVLSELGSHSSALSVNDSPDRFQRLPGDETIADITNGAIGGVEALASLPVAYGLPRDEGGRLPFLVPELDGAPVYEHERLPSVDRTDLLPEALTVRSFDDLSSPPSDLSGRLTGLTFAHDSGGSGGDDATAPDADVTYDLVSTADLEHIAGFAGEQLSFEFAVPGFVEDAVASHLTAPEAPWDQPRYADPAADISDPGHRGALADRYDAVGDPAPSNALVARVSEAVASPDAPDGQGLTTRSSTVETVALLESDPAAVPTFRGVVAFRDVPDGEHRLTVNGAGLAPYSEPVRIGGSADAATETGTATETDTGSGDATAGAVGAGVTTAGAGAEVPLVARGDAAKLAVDPTDSDDELTDLAVEDDFAGRLYDAPLSGPDAVYVHRGGAYTTEVRDADDAVGAFRVNPGEEDRVTVDRPRTGKAPLAEYLADVAEETRADVAATLDGEDSDGGDGSGQGDGQNRGGGDGGPGNAARGLAQALEAIAEAARRAAERAEAGDRGRADASLDAVATRLERATERLAAARSDLPPGLARAADERFAQLDRRAEQARDAEKL